MRDDINKVVTERPRGGREFAKLMGRKARRQFNRFDDENYRTRTSMRPERGRDKELSDLLGPIKNFLRQRVGQKWDEVYSEISQVFNSNSWQGQHIKGHIKDMVETDVIEVDGVFCDTKGEPIMKEWSRRDVLFVHPVTKILSLTKKPKEEPRAKSDWWKIIDKDTFAMRESGVWYKHTLTPYQKHFRRRQLPTGRGFVDSVHYTHAFTGGYKEFLVCATDSMDWYDKREANDILCAMHKLPGRTNHVFALSEKRQIGSKEIKRLQLNK